MENAVYLYQYLRESQDLEAWINEQLQVAMSEDYGIDYEHLKVTLTDKIFKKLFENKQSVQVGSVFCGV